MICRKTELICRKTIGITWFAVKPELICYKTIGIPSSESGTGESPGNVDTELILEPGEIEPPEDEGIGDIDVSLLLCFHTVLVSSTPPMSFDRQHNNCQPTDQHQATVDFPALAVGDEFDLFASLWPDRPTRKCGRCALESFSRCINSRLSTATTPPASLGPCFVATVGRVDNSSMAESVGSYFQSRLQICPLVGSFTHHSGILAYVEPRLRGTIYRGSIRIIATLYRRATKYPDAKAITGAPVCSR
jgi:hypothetical protein